MPSIGDQLLLRRGDLTNFPKETVDLILDMQKEGWRGHRNAKGHVKMLAPDGETYVMATQNHNSPTYVRSGYNQYNKKHGKEEVNIPSPKLAQKWPCARPTCPKVYLSEEQLNTHIAVDHEKMLLCEYGGCFEVRASKQKLSIHMTHAHGYVSPRKAQRKKQEAKRQKDFEELTKANAELLVDEIKEIQKEEILNGESKNGRLNFVENTVDTLYSSKFDYKFDENLINVAEDSEVVRTDSMRARDIVPDYEVHKDGSVTDNSRSLKSLSAKYFDSKEVFDRHVELADARDAEGLHFLDDRDSWVIDHELLGRRRIHDMEEMFTAAGLKMEIRVWKVEK